jgi:chromosome segregation ATPase
MPTLFDRILNRQEQNGIATSVSAEELQSFIAIAREESERLAALVDQSQRDLRDTGDLQEYVAQLEKRLFTANTDLKSLVERMDSAQSAVELVENINQRSQTIQRAVEEANQKLRAVDQLSTELHKTREQFQPLIQAGLAADSKLASFRSQAEQLQSSRMQAEQLGEQLDNFQEKFSLIVEDYERVRDATASMRNQATAMDERAQYLKEELDRANAIKQEIGDTLTALSSSESIYKKTAHQLHQLNALSEHVSKKVRSLSVAKELVDRANAQCTQVNEVVWDTEQKIKKLDEQREVIGRVEDDIDRLQGLHEQAQAKLTASEQYQKDFIQRSTTLKTELEASVTAIREHLDNAKVMREELEVANRRVADLNSSIGRFEDRVKLLGDKEQKIGEAVKNAEGLLSRLGGLRKELDSLHSKVQVIGTLEERLDGLSDLSAKVNGQIESIADNRSLVEQTGRQLEEFTTVHTELQAQLEDLRRNRTEVDHIHRLFSEFRRASSDTEYAVKQMEQRLTTVDEANSRIIGLQLATEKLEVRATEMSSRMEYVEGIESRLNRLNELSQSINSRISEQVNKKAELDSMRVAQEGLTQQLNDAQKLAASLTESRSLSEMQDRMVNLEGHLDNFRGKLVQLSKLETEVRDREKRSEDLAVKLTDFTSTLEHQSGRLSVLDSELGKVNETRTQWLQAVSRVEARQRDINSQSETTELQLKQLAEVSRELEEKRSALTVTEAKLARYEERLSSFERMLGTLDGKIDYVNSRQDSVEQVRRQVSSIFQTCERTRDDALSIMDSRKDILDAKEKLDHLLGRTVSIDEKFAALDAKQSTIDDAEYRINALNNVMSDIHVNLQSFKQQKEVIDHIGDKLMRLDFALKRAEVLTKELHEERELARRIYQNIRALRTSRPKTAVAQPQPQLKPPEPPKTS